MVNMLERPEISASDRQNDANATGELELPTNLLNSANLQGLLPSSAPLQEADQEANDLTVDWVQRLSKANPITEVFTDEEPDLQFAPSGMRHHDTGPARMVPAKRQFLSRRLKRSALALLVTLAIGGLIGGGVYALVDSGWLSTLVAPQPASSTDPPGSGQQIASTPGTLPPPTQEPTPQPQPAQLGNADQIRDKGIEEYKRGKYEEAIKLFESAAAMGTNDARVFYHLGLAYLAVTGREYSLDDAELAFRTAVSLEPTWGAAHNMLAESLVRRGYFSEAIQPALEATRLDPNSGDSWLTLSRAYKGAGQEAEATRAYAEASRRAPVPPMQP